MRYHYMQDTLDYLLARANWLASPHKTWQVVASSLNVRLGPGTTNASVLALFYGDVVELGPMRVKDLAGAEWAEMQPGRWIRTSYLREVTP